MSTALATAVLVAVLPWPAAGTARPPVEAHERARPPQITADSWILYDVDAGAVLAEHNSRQRRPMASVTKLMSALVASERSSPDELVVISEHAAATGEAEIGLVPGEMWSIQELLTAMMVRSGNDAAVAVAEHVGGSVASFAGLMNERADELGMGDSHFLNPHGLDVDGHYTTAYDLMLLAVTALDDPVLGPMMRIHSVKFRPDPEGKVRRATNTNRLLGVSPGIIGMKTGFTSRAGRVLISAAEHGDRRLVAVVMASEDHFADSRRLLDYGFRTHGPGDILLAPLAVQEGGGGQVASAAVPDWLRVRIASVPALDNGRWATTPPLSTPLGAALRERFESLLPDLGAGDG